MHGVIFFAILFVAKVSIPAEPQSHSQYVAVVIAGLCNIGRSSPSVHSHACGTAYFYTRSRNALLWLPYNPHG